MLQNTQIKSYLKTLEGQTLFFLVKEFLEFFNLHFTLQVLDSEAYLESLPKYDKSMLKERLNLTTDLNEMEVPLLHKIITSKNAQGKNNILDINLNLSSNLNGDTLHPATEEVKSSLHNNDSHSSASHISTEQDTTIHSFMTSDTLDGTPNMPQDGPLSKSESLSKVIDKFQPLNSTFILSPIINQSNGSEKSEISIDSRQEASNLTLNKPNGQLHNQLESEKLVEYADDFISGHSSISSKGSETSKAATESSIRSLGSKSQGDSKKTSSNTICSKSTEK